MKRFVYMIDYTDDRDYQWQMECEYQKDCKIQLKYLKEEHSVITNLKLVNKEYRWEETNVSSAFIKWCIKFLGYKPVYISSND